MNKEILKPKKVLSSFFFENRLYEFSQKKLKPSDRLAMKSMTSESPDAKYRIGTVLMSLEYLEKIEDVVLTVNEEELLTAARRKSKISRALNFVFFLALTTCFFVSGYFVLTEHILKGAN